ncbi:MAG TPA: radical SAM protein [Polyangiaceae bacterium]|nr:radical SAM protein [Polyangiaceae bacterium]
MARRKLYLVHPRPADTDQYEADLIPNAAGMADAAMVTVAALAPEDKFEFKLCEESIEPVDFDHPADFVGITGKNAQGARMIEIARRFRARGVPVIFGGPHATLAAGELREHCDIIVKGELEPIAQTFFDDLYRGEYQREYFGPRGHFADSPVPRWDLYPNDRALCGTLQTSRGCPFECEFCDVIAYLGRKQSHKAIDRVLAELDLLYRVGYRQVMLADDNLTVYRARARELLKAIADWNGKVEEPLSFRTQLSIEITNDPEVLELLAKAGVRNVFVGIESPNQDALKETKKRQNVGVDMVERTERFARHGILVQAGCIVGFDSDTPKIFQQQLEFAQRSPIPIFTPAPLHAAHGTPLRERMAQTGRLNVHLPMSNSISNFVPAQMSLAQQQAGVDWLIRELYAPDNFTRRLLRMIELFPSDLRPSRARSRPIAAEATLACHRLLREAPDSARVVTKILAALRHKPGAREAALFALFVWAQRRYQLRRTEPVPVAPPTEALPLVASSGVH